MISHDPVRGSPGLLRQRIADAIAYRETSGPQTPTPTASSSAKPISFPASSSIATTTCSRCKSSPRPWTPNRCAKLSSLNSPTGCSRRPSSSASIPAFANWKLFPPRSSGLLQGEKTATTFTMNGVQFHYDALEGQKTGAFLDQRENYAAAAQYAKGEALDVFCYQGGFALHLAPHCSQVTGVDSSRPALEVADQNAALNHALLEAKRIEWIEANAFDLLKDYAAADRRYDTIVLDPPPSPRPSATSKPPCAATRNSTCAP